MDSNRPLDTFRAMEAARHAAKVETTATGRVYIGRADAYFTTKDEQAGYPETRKRLAGYPDDMLQRDYLEAQRDSFGNLFGHNARRFGNLVVDEMLSRGLTEIPNIFGAIQVRRFEQ